ncbi:hypothetical protein MMPV_003682 [Pyropia vietnamensis]
MAFVPAPARFALSPSPAARSTFTSGAAAAAPSATTAVAPLSRRATLTMVDYGTLSGLGVAIAGAFGGVALMAFTEQQGKRGQERVNVQPCVECRGSKVTTCNLCKGSGVDPLVADGKVSADGDGQCNYCEGVGELKCFNCAGSGIQPRFLDRLSPDDFMD